MEASTLHQVDQQIYDHNIASKCLELTYHKASRQADNILWNEESRRLRLRIILLEDENDSLQEQLLLSDEQTESLDRQLEDMQSQMSEMEDVSTQRDAALRSQSRDLTLLKAELASMNVISTDSAKLLTEKLSLTRDLATLKPELEHLRSQSKHQQTILAEKLALQRQVNTLEVELETGKTALKRASGKKEKDIGLEALKRQLDETRQDAIAERRAKETTKKSSEKDFRDWETQRELLEGKLEQMRTKLRSTKEQLKETNIELAQSRAASSKSIVTGTNDCTKKIQKKRTYDKSEMDAAVGTPDGLVGRGKRANAKRNKLDQSYLGEKSTFSITPLLNRTISMSKERPAEEAGQHLDVAEARSVSNTVMTKDNLSSTTRDLSLDDPKTIKNLCVIPDDGEARGTTKGTDTGLRPALAESVASNCLASEEIARPREKLESVEEEDEENSGPLICAATATKAVKASRAKPQLPSDRKDETAEPKKKKRTLLNSAKTIFDDDDGEATKRPAKKMFGAVRSLNGGTRLLAKGNTTIAQPASNSAFGDFSPLKKDKRGAQASFLI